MKRIYKKSKDREDTYSTKVENGRGKKGEK